MKEFQVGEYVAGTDGQMLRVDEILGDGKYLVTSDSVQIVRGRPVNQWIARLVYRLQVVSTAG